ITFPDPVRTDFTSIEYSDLPIKLPQRNLAINFMCRGQMALADANSIDVALVENSKTYLNKLKFGDWIPKELKAVSWSIHTPSERRNLYQNECPGIDEKHNCRLSFFYENGPSVWASLCKEVLRPLVYSRDNRGVRIFRRKEMI
ncbi:unnamed protein product, partial [Allacma fusca]